MLKYECSICDPNHPYIDLGRPMLAFTSRVRPAPNLPVRNLVPLPLPYNVTKAGPSSRFTVLSYNMLADLYAKVGVGRHMRDSPTGTGTRTWGAWVAGGCVYVCCDRCVPLTFNKWWHCPEPVAVHSCTLWLALADAPQSLSVVCLLAVREGETFESVCIMHRH